MFFIFCALGIIFLLIIVYYNILIVAKNRVNNAWAQVDVQLKRRHDLIPNLVNTVKGYMEHEKSLLEKIARLRNQAARTTDMDKRIAVENSLDGALLQLYALVEAYPQLTAHENFLSLQEELTTTENRIAYARQAYNDQVMLWNNKIAIFPTNLVAALFNFQAAAHYHIDRHERNGTIIKFNKGGGPNDVGTY